jgi:ABC-type glycerol-3-phosphate transport system substrate-binding protein
MQKIRQRKNMNNKFLPVFFLVIFISLVLSACGNTNKPTEQPSKTTSTPTQTKKATSLTSSNPTRTPTSTPEPVSKLGVTPEDLDGIEIEIWHSWSGLAGEEFDRLIKDFNETNEWNILVDSSYQGDYDQTYENLSLSLEDGTRPDLVVSYNYQALGLEAPEEVFVDLETFSNDPVWGFRDIRFYCCLLGSKHPRGRTYWNPCPTVRSTDLLQRDLGGGIGFFFTAHHPI